MKYMQMELQKDQQESEKEKVKMYIHYLSNVFSHPLTEKPSQQYLRAKKEFEDMIHPKLELEKENKPAKVYQWDFERKQPLGNNPEGR